MKRLLALALCALFACQAGARTLYVDAMSPNNNGNGLSAAKAKKTLQAAINVAKKGDTIIVAPGVYGQIDTKNMKLKIKASKGASQTTVLYQSGSAVANLGAAWKKKYSWNGHYDSYGQWVPAGSSTYSSEPERKGTSTSVSGLTLNGGNNYPTFYGVQGGTLQSCIVKNVNSGIAVCRSKLTGCTICDNDDFQVDESTLARCKVLNNKGQYPSESSKFSNCLFACNTKTSFKSCTFANCTVADGTGFAMTKSTAWNTIFHKVASSQFKNAKKNKLKNCYKGSNPKFVSTKSTKKTWVADYWGSGSRITGAEVRWTVFDENGEWADGGSVFVTGTTDAEILAAAKATVGNPDAQYEIYNYNYESGYYKKETVPGDYRLKAGSPCINKGTTAAAAKKLYGSKDLAGKKRVKGKSVDIGCYEY